MNASATAARPPKSAPGWLPDHIDAITTSQLFAGLTLIEIAAMLPCLDANVKTFDRGEFILRMGQHNSRVFLILAGKVTIMREDWWGNRHIISSELPGSTFAEAYALTPHVPLGVSAIATEPTTILSLDARSILAPCSNACPFHASLLENLVAAIAERNLRLNNKLTYLSQRTTREKLLAYLSDESARQGSASLTIQFNRQELADFLSVNRSAMSSELGRMRDEGILTYEKNHFTLLRNPLS